MGWKREALARLEPGQLPWGCSGKPGWGHFSWGSSIFPTLEEHGGTVPTLKAREGEVGAQPRGLRQPWTTPGLLVRAGRDGRGGPSN